METEAQMLARGPEAVLYAILDQVVDGYAPVVAGLENDIDEIETEVFGGDPNASRRIYGLSREVIQFQRAARPCSACSTRSPTAPAAPPRTRSCAATCAT
ncbi:CorA family divalent cation transporter [Micromonospora sp. M12]